VVIDGLGGGVCPDDTPTARVDDVIDSISFTFDEDQSVSSSHLRLSGRLDIGSGPAISDSFSIAVAKLLAPIFASSVAIGGACRSIYFDVDLWGFFLCNTIMTIYLSLDF